MKKRALYRKVSKGFYIVGMALLISAIIFNFLPPMKAFAAEKVTLCHATPPDTAAGGWGEITTDVSSDGHLRGGHDTSHDADIIPAYSSTLADGSVFNYPGKNLSTIFDGYTGEEILANGCVLPTPPTPPPPPDGSAGYSIGACTASESGGSTAVTITIDGAIVHTGSIAGDLTSTTTLNLSPGSYSFSWDAATGFTGSGTLNFTIDGCYPPPPPSGSASATMGSCSWDPASGSLTSVDIAISNATVHTGGVAGDLTSSTTLHLTSGSYSFPWEADSGYQGSGTLTFSVSDCTPGYGSVSSNPGSCSWTVAGDSVTQVDITISNAIVHTGAYYGDLTTSQTIALGPGSYSFPWEGSSGYLGTGTLSFTLSDCTPADASVSAVVGSCSWTAAGGSKTAIDITISGAVVHTGTADLTSSTTLNLSSGHYEFAWEATAGFIGSGVLSFDVGDCIPPDASASAGVGTCSWTSDNGPITPVTITIEGAIVDAGVYGGFLSSTTVLDLGAGNYSFPWAADSTHKGSGTLAFSVLDCTPGVASAIANIGTCSWNLQTGSSTSVEITILNATVHTGATLFGDLTSSQTINLAPGTYSFPWGAQEGYFGSGTLDLTIGDCTLPAATADPTSIGECTWSAETGSTTPVTITILGASVNTSPIDGTITTTTTLAAVPPGSYSFPWIALPGYTGSGNVDFSVGSCAPSLQLTSFCSFASPNYPDGWTVINLNSFAVPFDWQYGSESSSATINLPGSSSATFTTGNHPGDQMQIYSGGELLASFGANDCPVFQDLQLAATCAADPTHNNEWIITNPNSSNVNFEYTGAGGVAGTGVGPANSSLHLTTPITTSSDDLALFVDSVPQAYAKAATNCSDEQPIVPSPPETLNDPIIVPETGGTQPAVIIIPVTGLDLQRRALPGTMVSFSLGFLGLGLVFGGFGRRRGK